MYVPLSLLSFEAQTNQCGVTQDRPAEETTDTLVLTSALKYYTDVRILLSGSQKTLPPSSTPLDAARLEWGFAGRAYSTPADEKTGTAAHTKWVHWIDNKTKEQVEDAGWMYPVEGTNDVLEKGTMLNPETGKEGPYQEMWTDLDIEKAVLPREEGYVSWVLQLEGEGGKGLVVRIGQWVQGVVRRGEEVSVARWKGGNNGWEKVLEVGRLDLGAALGKENEDGQKTWVVGDVFKGKDGEWKCVESLTW